MDDITPAQVRVYFAITDAIDEKGYPPTVQEIADRIGLASKSTVHGHLGILEEKGYIKRNAKMPRAIKVLDE